MIDLTCIIDDDPIVLAVGKKLIFNHSYFSEVTTAQNGDVALNYIQGLIEHNDRLPGLILLDLNMPVMDGWEFLDKVQSIDKLQGVPIYIFTSSINPADIERSKLYSSVKGYISKPLTLTVLDNLAMQLAS